MSIRTHISLNRVLAFQLSLTFLLAAPVPLQAGSDGFQPVQKMLDLSGLAWIEGDKFLAVHDAKLPEEAGLTRVSLIDAPESIAGIQWKPLQPHFPETESSDLESASRIPGTPMVLLAESGDDGGKHDRIFLARVTGNDVTVDGSVHWRSFYPDIYNVEATAVAASGSGYLFIWAERADGGTSTEVRWTDLTLEPFAIGASGQVDSATYSLPAELASRFSRPLVGMDLDDQGRLYGVAAYDPGSDEGPYRSAILKIGKVADGAVLLDSQPSLQATLDGFKTESVTLRGMGRTAVYVGTDDENYGGTFRPLPAIP